MDDEKDNSEKTISDLEKVGNNTEPERKWSPLAKRDPDRDKIELKDKGGQWRKKRGRKKRNTDLEITDEIKEKVMVWASSGKISRKAMARILDTTTNFINEKMGTELSLGKEICCARTELALYRTANSGDKTAIVFQAQKEFLQKYHDYNAKVTITNKNAVGDAGNVVKGMNETEKMQRTMHIAQKKGLFKPKDRKIPESIHKNIDFN